jgi:uncharacterized membrane protein
LAGVKFCPKPTGFAIYNLHRFLRRQAANNAGRECKIKAKDSKDKRISPIRILGITVLVIGLLVAVWQALDISNEVYFGDQSSLLGDLCWIAVGMAIEFFGIGLIIVGNTK